MIHNTLGEIFQNAVDNNTEGDEITVLQVGRRLPTGAMMCYAEPRKFVLISVNYEKNIAYTYPIGYPNRLIRRTLDKRQWEFYVEPVVKEVLHYQAVYTRRNNQRYTLSQTLYHSIEQARSALGHSGRQFICLATEHPGVMLKPQDF